jgi:hypothetical protein
VKSHFLHLIIQIKKPKQLMGILWKKKNVEKREGGGEGVDGVEES